MTTHVLDAARAIKMPSREALLRREHSAQRFWRDHRALLESAWAEWDSTLSAERLDTQLFAPALRDAVEEAWANPGRELAVAELWDEVFSGVYSAQFFDPTQLDRLRDFLEQASLSGIPARPPYGIALNRDGLMLDPRSEGYLASPNFQMFYKTLMARYLRPISRLLFPDVAGYDGQTFGFSIRYEPGTDTALQPHTDASSVTLNVNINRPEEAYTGSGVRFFDPASQQIKELFFGVGEALLHHGSVPHEAKPITSGERSNLVFWLYGKAGQTSRLSAKVKPMIAQERWTTVDEASDGFAPF